MVSGFASWDESFAPLPAYVPTPCAPRKRETANTVFTVLFASTALSPCAANAPSLNAAP